LQFAQQNLNVKLFYENDDPDTWISMVPTSAHSGDGMGNLMAYVVQHCQNRLAKRLAFSENLQCTVLEVSLCLILSLHDFYFEVQCSFFTAGCFKQVFSLKPWKKIVADLCCRF